MLKPNVCIQYRRFSKVKNLSTSRQKEKKEYQLDVYMVSKANFEPKFINLCHLTHHTKHTPSNSNPCQHSPHTPHQRSRWCHWRPTHSLVKSWRAACGGPQGRKTSPQRWDAQCCCPGGCSTWRLLCPLGRAAPWCTCRRRLVHNFCLRCLWLLRRNGCASCTFTCDK